MRVPALYIGATLVFWGIESGNLVIATLMALVIESSYILSTKWHLTKQDFVRISDFTSIIFLAAVSLVLLNYETIYFLKVLIRWLPIILLPLILAQLYSTNEQIIIGTQWGFKKKEAHTHKPLDFRFVYCLVCIFSAAIANSRSELFFPSIFILFSWIFFTNRGRAFPIPAFALFISIAIVLGLLGHKGFSKGHNYLVKSVDQMMRNYYWERFADPFQASLSFGTLKKDKLSAKILLRLQTQQDPPLLLKQASYDTYFQKSWKNNSTFNYIPMKDKGWQLLPRPAQEGDIARAEFYLPKERGLLPLPMGSYRIEGKYIYELERNSAGIIKALDAASLATYDINFDTQVHDPGDTPSAMHLAIPDEEEYVITQIARNMKLQDISQHEQIQTVTKFFQKYFNYSLKIQPNNEHPTALGNFLLGDRQGYCEMFATATALLLRNAGIPSRYVTGFVALEYSQIEKKYLIRERHAHAWTEAYINGKWIAVDTTPAIWPEADRQHGSLFESITDLFSFFKLHYEHFRMETELRYQMLLSGIIVVLTLFLGYRVYLRLQVQGISHGQEKSIKHFKGETPFSLVEKRLAISDSSRGIGESFMSWLRRIDGIEEMEFDHLARLYSLHQKLRFDPNETSEKDLEMLNTGVQDWLKIMDSRETTRDHKE